jgi:hypothetical protein
MIIIELIGIPGCGKTTTIQRALDCRQEGDYVLFLNKDFFFRFSLFLKATIAFIKHRKQLSGFCQRWLRVIKHAKEVKWNIRYKIGVFEFLQFLCFYDIISKNDDRFSIAISDQWVFQHTFSIFHDRPISGMTLNCISELYDEIQKIFDGRYYVIMCECDTTRILRQINGRSDGRSVIDGINIKELERIISIQQDNIYKTYSIVANDNRRHIVFNGNLEIQAHKMNLIISELYGKR